MQHEIQQARHDHPVPIPAVGQPAVRGAQESAGHGREEVLSYFKDERLAGLLFGELERWKGTRFGTGPARARVGATCVTFVHAVLLNTGAIDPVNIPPYAACGSGPVTQRMLLDVLNGIPRFRRIWQRRDGAWPALMPGDTLAVLFPKGDAHLAVAGRLPALWHCWAASGVTEGNICDPLAERYTAAIYRPMAVAP